MVKRWLDPQHKYTSRVNRSNTSDRNAYLVLGKGFLEGEESIVKKLTERLTDVIDQVPWLDFVEDLTEQPKRVIHLVGVLVGRIQQPVAVRGIAKKLANFDLATSTDTLSDGLVDLLVERLENLTVSVTELTNQLTTREIKSTIKSVRAVPEIKRGENQRV
jgi:hypothetical protein